MHNIPPQLFTAEVKLTKKRQFQNFHIMGWFPQDAYLVLWMTVYWLSIGSNLLFKVSIGIIKQNVSDPKICFCTNVFSLFYNKSVSCKHVFYFWSNTFLLEPAMSRLLDVIRHKYLMEISDYYVGVAHSKHNNDSKIKTSWGSAA